MKEMNLEAIKELFERLKSTDLYCWGSGKYFRNHTLPFLRESGLIKNLKGVIDPGDRKIGNERIHLTPQGEDVDVICRAELAKLRKDRILIIISVVGYREILSQMQVHPDLAQVKALPATFLEALYEDMQMLTAPKPPANYRKNPKETIPRVIHTFWFSDTGDKTHKDTKRGGWEPELPQRYRTCLESWKKYAPDYEIKIWNRDTYVARNCIYFEQAIRQECWAFASDYARADVLRRYGGVYMDLDVEMLRPIDDLLYNDAYMSFESLQRIECGSGMGAKAGNRILDEICKEYESKPFIKADGSLDLSTCPVRFTKILEKHGLVKNGGFQMVEDITVYPFEVLTGKGFDTGILYTTDLSYTRHHHNGSWVPGHTLRAMEQRYEEITEFLK